MFVKLFDIIFEEFPRAVAYPVAGVLAWVLGRCLTVYGGLGPCILVGILAVG